MDLINEMFGALGVTDPDTLGPEDKLYREWTASGDKHQKIYNCQYWLKHELYVYLHLKDKNYLVCKNTSNGRVELDIKVLAKSLLEYYFLMTQSPRFKSDDSRPEMAHKLADLPTFVDLILEHDAIKKLIANPHGLI